MTSHKERYDLVVIGSGPAGEKGAVQAAYFGKKVAIIEKAHDVGGASVHTGTLPSKTLRETALYLTGFRRRRLYGMTVRLSRKKSLRQLVGRLSDVIEQQTTQIRRNLERHQVTLIRGVASFDDPHTVRVATEDGPRLVTAEFFLIATGSSPLPPRGITFEDPDVVNSDRILELDSIPHAMVVVGGGVIGCEYACTFAALGTRVTVIEGRDRLLSFLDGEMSSAMKLALERMGGEVLLSDAVESIERVPGRRRHALEIKLKSGRVLKADKILFSAGRRGNTEGLGLERAGVKLDPNGRLIVDAHFATNVPHIYAAGDVIGFPALASTSMEQGRVAMCHAFAIKFKDRVSPVLPYGIYAIPEIGMVGSTEEELRQAGVPYEVGRARFENNPRGQITGEMDGLLKILFSVPDKKLLGAHIIGEGATELVHIPEFVLSAGGTIDEFIHAVFNYPTLSEAFKYAAYDGLQRLARRSRKLEQDRGQDHGEVSGIIRAAAPMPPPARGWFLGVNLTDPSATEPVPVVVAAMDRWRRVRFFTWTYNEEGQGLVPQHMAREGFVLAIDGPQGLGRNGAAGRASERLVRAQAADRADLPRASDVAGFIMGSVRLFSALRRQLLAAGLCVLGEGPNDSAALLEVAPGDLWPKWYGKVLAKKSTPQGRRQRYDLLRGLGMELPADAGSITHDQLDATCAAYAGYLWATGNARLYGEAPEWDEGEGVLREGFIVSI